MLTLTCQMWVSPNCPQGHILGVYSTLEEIMSQAHVRGGTWYQEMENSLIHQDFVNVMAL